MGALEAGDIEEGCHGPALYYIPCFKVHLKNRTGWQNAQGYDGPQMSEFLKNLSWEALRATLINFL